MRILQTNFSNPQRTVNSTKTPLIWSTREGKNRKNRKSFAFKVRNNRQTQYEMGF